MKKKNKKRFWIGIRILLVVLFFGLLVVMDKVRPEREVRQGVAQLRVFTEKTQEKALDLAQDAQDLKNTAQKEAEKKFNSLKDYDIPIRIPSDMPAFPKLIERMPPLPPLPRMVQPESLFHEEAIYEETHKTISMPTLTPKPQATPFMQKGKGAKIAIIIDDVGLNAQLSARTVALPSAVTLSYLPYAPHIDSQIVQAKGAGHSILLHLPMEPKSTISAGPMALTTALDHNEFQSRLDTTLDRFTGYDGVNNHMGSKLTESRTHMETVMTALASRGLFFIDSRTTAHSEAQKIAQEKGLKTASRDVFLDDDPAPSSIEAQLVHLESVARKKGYAIAIGHPYVSTLSVLEKWLPKAQENGFLIVPARELLQ